MLGPVEKLVLLALLFALAQSSQIHSPGTGTLFGVQTDYTCVFRSCGAYRNWVDGFNLGSNGSWASVTASTRPGYVYAAATDVDGTIVTIGPESFSSLSGKWAVHRFNTKTRSMSRVTTLPWVPLPLKGQVSLALFQGNVGVAINNGRLYIFEVVRGILLSNASLSAMGGTFAALNSTHGAFMDYSLGARAAPPAFPAVCNDTTVYPFYPIVLLEAATGKRTVTGAVTNQNLAGIVGAGNSLYAFNTCVGESGYYALPGTAYRMPLDGSAPQRVASGFAVVWPPYAVSGTRVIGLTNRINFQSNYSNTVTVDIDLLSGNYVQNTYANSTRNNAVCLGATIGAA